MKRYVKFVMLAPIFLFLLTGCPGNVKKECPVCVPKTYIVNEGIPEPAKVEEPVYPTDQLTAESTDEDVAKAYVSSEKLARTYADQLEEALKPFIDAWKRSQDVKTQDQ